MRLLPALALAALPLGVALTSAASSPAIFADEDALHESMEVLQKSQRALKKLIKDPEANGRVLLETLGGMEAATLVALGEPAPAAPEGMEGKEAGLFEVGYKRTLVSLLDTTLKMQEATLEGKADELAAAYKELSELKGMGHEVYRDAGE